MATTVEQMARQIKTLTDKEQAQLRALLGADALPETPIDQELQFARHLLAQGMLDHIPPGYPEGYVEPPAITIDGEPLSETILRERR